MHYGNATVATDSPARQLQMLLWYTDGVPPGLIRQIIRVERWHTQTAILERSLHTAEMEEAEFEMEEAEWEGYSRPSMPRTDDSWVSMDGYEPVGFESVETGFGFSNYFPRHDSDTEAEHLLTHISANFHTRRIRLLHAASYEEFAILLTGMYSFIVQALESFEHLDYGDDLQNRDDDDDLVQRWAEEKELLTTFQVEGIKYDGPSGFSGLGEESDANDVEEAFPNGMPTAIENARKIKKDAGVKDDEAGEEEDGPFGKAEDEEQSEGQSES